MSLKLPVTAGESGREIRLTCCPGCAARLGGGQARFCSQCGLEVELVRQYLAAGGARALRRSPGQRWTIVGWAIACAGLAFSPLAFYARDHLHQQWAMPLVSTLFLVGMLIRFVAGEYLRQTSAPGEDAGPEEDGRQVPGAAAEAALPPAREPAAAAAPPSVTERTTSLISTDSRT